jgi:hypothetical protein
VKALRLVGSLGAIVLVALSLGAGPASATVLCAEAETEEACNNTYPAGTTLEANLAGSSKATLSTSITNVTCDASTANGKVVAPGGSGKAVEAEIESLTFSGDCTTGGGTSCTATTVNLPYSASITGSGGNGTLTITDSVGAGAKVVCGFLINCTLTAKSLGLGLTGGSPAIAKMEGVSLEKSGGFCPATSALTAEYEFAAPDPLFVAQKKASMAAVPASESFGVNQTRPMVVENNGETTWQITTIELENEAPAGGFSLDKKKCPGTNLAPGGKCSVDITCKSGSATAKLVFRSTIGSIKATLNC